MELGNVAEYLGLGLTVVASAAGAVFHLSARLTKLETKVDALWEFLMRRALSEAVNKGLGTMNSPFRSTPEALSWFEPVREQLRARYATVWHALDENAFAFEVEKEFGPWMQVHVCVPHNLDSGGCLWVAMEVARGKPKDE